MRTNAESNYEYVQRAELKGCVCVCVGEALYANLLNVVRNVCVGVRTNFTLFSSALAFITRNTEPLSKLLGR